MGCVRSKWLHAPGLRALEPGGSGYTSGYQSRCKSGLISPVLL